MEPSTTPDYSGSTEVKTVTKSNLLMICDPLCKVTPVSKYLAMLVFIILPFIGAYVGYQLAGEEVEEEIESTQLAIPNAEQPSRNTITYTGPRATYQKLSEVVDSSSEYAITDNTIVCKNEVEETSVPYSDEAVISTDIDVRYLIIGTSLYWNCQKIGSIDKDTLRVVNKITSDIQDDTTVYFSGVKIADADGSTFMPVIFTGPNLHQSSVAYRTNYYKDSDHVYYIRDGQAVIVLDGALPNGFETLESGFNNRYAKATDTVYYQGKAIEVGSVEDFEIVEGLGIDGTALYVEGVKTADGVTKAGLTLYQEEDGALGGSTNILVSDSIKNKWYRLEVTSIEGEPLYTLKLIATPAKNNIGMQLYPIKN